MNSGLSKNPLALAVAAAVSAAALCAAPPAMAAKTPGKYVAGDFHNHTTCSDGSISMQKLVKKATDKVETPWGLDWFVQAGHGGNGNRNCTLTEDATLDTPVYPFTGQQPTTSWQNTTPPVAPKGLASGTAPNQNMWRWQSIQEFQYPVVEYLNAFKQLPLFIGLESVVAGHEHSSMSVISGQIPLALDTATLPTSPIIAANSSRYAAIGNANALAQWEYCFDRGDTDTSRGNATVGTVPVAGGNNWNCSVTGSANAGDTNWNATAQKLVGNNGVAGHNKTLEALKWINEHAPNEGYYVPAHLERAGPFNTAGSNGYNVEHLRNFNNTAPKVAFGFESQPGHGASAARGEYTVLRNPGFPGEPTNIDSVGGTTYGGTGVYAGQVGGVWDALLGEGRNWWFFASSDWHNRGSFGPDDRRSTQDFYPGEYQRTYALVRNGTDPKLRPQAIVDALRTGNAWSSSGQLIDRLAFVACISYPGLGARSNAFVENLAVNAATNDTDTDTAGCATMGEKVKAARPGGELVVSVVLRDPAGANFSPYTFANPSLAQVGVSQPLDHPVLDHVDLVRGNVTGYRTPGTAGYSGEWPRNFNWLHADGTTPADLSNVPDAAKNTSAAVIKTFNSTGWTPVVAADGSTYLKMTFRVPAVNVSQYVRLRGTNMPAAVPFETDANGNPLADIYTNATSAALLRIPCLVAHSAGNQFDGCPDHLAVLPAGQPNAGQKAVSFDVAAWSDLWFYSNPIYVEVAGSTLVAGVQ